MSVALSFTAAASAEVYDVYETQGNVLTKIATIDAFGPSNTTHGTAAGHYDYRSSGGHPEAVNLGGVNSNFWVWLSYHGVISSGGDDIASAYAAAAITLPHLLEMGGWGG